MGNDFAPTTDEKLDDWAKLLCQLALERTSGTPPEWPHILKARVDQLNAVYADWYLAFSLMKKPHTPQDTHEKNRMRDVLKGECRVFINEFIRNSSYVSKKDRESVGVYDAKPGHRIEPPLTSPVLSPHAGMPGQVVVPYRDESSSRRGKPHNVHGIEVRWVVADSEPATREEFIHSSFDTRSPLYLNFGKEDRGKQVFMFGLWEIEREGEKGPPGETASCFIA